MSSVFRPLGNRVLIKPAPKRSESAGGLSIVEDYQPDTVGTVVALGDGLEQRKLEIQRFALGLMYELEAGGVRRAVLETIQRHVELYAPAHVVKVGDEVTFGVNAGSELDLGGETYLLIDEADLEAILEPVTA